MTVDFIFITTLKLDLGKTISNHLVPTGKIMLSTEHLNFVSISKCTRIFALWMLIFREKFFFTFILLVYSVFLINLQKFQDTFFKWNQNF